MYTESKDTYFTFLINMDRVLFQGHECQQGSCVFYELFIVDKNNDDSSSFCHHTSLIETVSKCKTQ